MKVPTVPFQLPLSKTYYGLEEMKNGELDFLKGNGAGKVRCAGLPVQRYANG